MSQNTSKPKNQPAPSEHPVQSSQSTDDRAPRPLTLVPAPVAERQPLLAEPAATELRDLIRSLQKQHVAHRSQPEGGSPADEPLSAA